MIITDASNLPEGSVVSASITGHDPVSLAQVTPEQLHCWLQLAPYTPSGQSSKCKI